MLLTVGHSNGVSALQLKDQFGSGLQSRAASAAEAPPGDAGRGRDRRAVPVGGSSPKRQAADRLRSRARAGRCAGTGLAADGTGLFRAAAATVRDRRGDSGNRDQSRRLALLRGFSELAAIDGRRPSGAQGSGMDPLHVFKPRVPGLGVLQAFRPPSRRTGVPVEPAQPQQGKLWCAAPRRLASGSGTHALDACSGSGGCRAGGAAAVVFEPGPGGVSRRRASPRPRRRPRGRAPRRSCPRLTGSGPLR